MQTINNNHINAIQYRHPSEELRNHRTQLRSKRMSENQFPIHTNIISIDSFVGTTNDFLSTFDNIGLLRIDTPSNVNHLFRNSNPNSDQTLSLPLTVSSPLNTYDKRHIFNGIDSLNFDSAVKSNSFEYVMKSSGVLRTKKLISVLDARATTQSILNLRGHKKRTISNHNRESYVIDLKNSNRSSKLITSDLSLFLPALNEYLSNKTSFFLNETTLIKTSSERSSTSFRSLNEKINSTLYNLVSLKQLEDVRHQRFSIISIHRNSFCSQHSTSIDYFDPIHTKMDQYIDLTSKSLKRSSHLASNRMEVSNMLNIDNLLFRKFQRNNINEFLTVSSHSVQSSRPDSITVQSCCVKRCFTTKLKQEKKTSTRQSVVRSIRNLRMSNKRLMERIVKKRQKVN